MNATVTVKCVGCGHREEVGPQQDVPMCSKCFSPMVAESAESDDRKDT